jgi:protein-S-isoprenylcysteine O-methyltransferase
MAVGQIARTLAMVQAGTNFSHTMQVERKDDHTLVKDGIYSILRHPSYFGFFWWGLGTQVVLGNMICSLGYAIILWQFFSSRIQSEPDTLQKLLERTLTSLAYHRGRETLDQVLW